MTKAANERTMSAAKKIRHAQRASTTGFRPVAVEPVSRSRPAIRSVTSSSIADCSHCWYTSRCTRRASTPPSVSESKLAVSSRRLGAHNVSVSFGARDLSAERRRGDP